MHVCDVVSSKNVISGSLPHVQELSSEYEY